MSGDDQQFCLRWNDFQVSLESSLADQCRTTFAFLDEHGGFLQAPPGREVVLRCHHCHRRPAYQSPQDGKGHQPIRICPSDHGLSQILCACSPYFKNLLEQNPAKHPIIILKDVPFMHLTAILEFMYAGEVISCMCN